MVWRGGNFRFGRLDGFFPFGEAEPDQVNEVRGVKQTTQCSYDELSFHLADSNTYRWFCCIGIVQDAPQKSTLQKNIKKVQPTTWESINRMLVLAASRKGIEKVRRCSSAHGAAAPHYVHDAPVAGPPPPPEACLESVNTRSMRARSPAGNFPPARSARAMRTASVCLPVW